MLKQAHGSSDTACGLCAHPVDLQLKGEAESSEKRREIITVKLINCKKGGKKVSLKRCHVVLLPTPLFFILNFCGAA